MSQFYLSTLALAIILNLSCCHGNPVMNRDLLRTKEILYSCVGKYAGRPPPNTSNQTTVKLDHFQCNRALFLVDCSILLHGKLTSETISEIEDVPNYIGVQEYKRCPPGVVVCTFKPVPEEIVLSEEDYKLFSSTMSDCVNQFLDPPIGFGNYTTEQLIRSDVLWCRLLFMSIRFSFEDYGKLTSPLVDDVRNHLEKKELLHQNKIKYYAEPRGEDYYRDQMF